ncbi:MULTISPECIES: helix-turn-helix domain-containing protein [Moraxella]|uniref:Winged helix-turn-helix domain-containing protein n=1 Tax=Moraxella catarrhalis TaxID=480 RepID=A0A7Z0UXX7_MORCA|nr:helix-turn-helix domain-containing protein [Moraxella catarrhalis]OAV00244.1 hypothetical protein AO382_1394 [Moraxella catarrhalis]STY82512.1 Uncharacterised protein [Moraxella catarrhalis]
MIQTPTPIPKGQCGILLEHLKSAPITHLEAVKMYNITGFLARISELRAMGYAITDTYQTSPKGARYKVYRMGAT